MSKIELQDTTKDVVMKMTEGNPGALQVIMGIIEYGGKIDPDDAFGGFGSLLHLDNIGVYGSKIWMLFKYICGCNLSHTIAMIRAVQLGILPEKELLDALSRPYANGIFDVPSYVAKVKERLKAFRDVGDVAELV